MKPAVTRFFVITLVTLASATLTFKALSRMQGDEESIQGLGSIAQVQVESPRYSIISIARATVRSAAKKLNFFHSFPASEAVIAEQIPAPAIEAAPVVAMQVLPALPRHIDLRLVPQAVVLPKAEENQVSTYLLVKR